MGVKDFPKLEGNRQADEAFWRLMDKLVQRQNIDDQIELTSGASGDELYIFDVSAGVTRKITVANLGTALASGLNVTSGTYTPTLTNVANLDASTAFVLQYMRVGSVVTVSGKVSVDPTAPATLTRLGISLPIASNFSAAEQCGGAAAAQGIAGQSASLLADATNDRAEMSWASGDVTNQSMFFSFTYQVI